jgi:hypothetical protein
MVDALLSRLAGPVVFSEHEAVRPNWLAVVIFDSAAIQQIRKPLLDMW